MANTNPDQFFNQGVEQYNKGDYNAALAIFQVALQGYREQQNQLAIGRVLNALGLTYYGLSNCIEAISYYIQAIAIFRNIQRLVLEADSLNNAGIAYDQLQLYIEARDCYQRALKLLEEHQEHDESEVSKANQDGIVTNLSWTQYNFYKQEVNYSTRKELIFRLKDEFNFHLETVCIFLETDTFYSNLLARDSLRLLEDTAEKLRSELEKGDVNEFPPPPPPPIVGNP